jgi:hypothetical protein
MVFNTARSATSAEVRFDIACWEELGSPLSAVVAQAIARWWGDLFEHAANLRAFGRGQEFNVADALEECLTIAPVPGNTVTALWEYLEDKR